MSYVFRTNINHCDKQFITIKNIIIILCYHVAKYTIGDIFVHTRYNITVLNSLYGSDIFSPEGSLETVLMQLLRHPF